MRPKDTSRNEEIVIEGDEVTDESTKQISRISRINSESPRESVNGSMYQVNNLKSDDGELDTLQLFCAKVKVIVSH